MKIFQYQYVCSLDSGSTTFDSDLINYFKINVRKTIEKVRLDVQKKIELHGFDIKRKWFFFNWKLWKLNLPIHEQTFDQWTRMEIVINEGDNTKNLHRLLSIYLRPWNKKFNLKNQDKIETELLNFDMFKCNQIMAKIFTGRTETYELYGDILFKPDSEEKESVYQKQIEGLESWFIWDLITRSMAKEDILNMDRIRKMSVTDIFDYLTICKVDKQIEEMRSSKNTLAL
jgi:hypothetical protein